MAASARPTPVAVDVLLRRIQRRHETLGPVDLSPENVRQLRHDVDDSCPIGSDGKRQHSFDYSEGGCRQVRDVELSANLGWATPNTGSALVMQRGD